MAQLARGVGAITLLVLSGCAGPLTIAAAGDLQISAERRSDHLGGLPRLLPGDLRLVNLEGPLTDAPLSSGAEDVRGSPAQAAWLRGRVDVVSLANNHADDAGPRGRADTRRALAAEGIVVVEDELLLGRARVAILARHYPPAHSLEDPGLEAAVTRLARRNLVMVSLHWGHTGSLLPSAAQRALARRLAHAGARLILGHGPHSVQGVERIGEALVAYSLGNLAFDCPCTKERDAYVLLARYERRRLVDASLRPIRAGLGEPPAPADDRELDELLTSLSAELGTHLVRDANGALHVALH